MIIGRSYIMFSFEKLVKSFSSKLHGESEHVFQTINPNAGTDESLLFFVRYARLSSALVRSDFSDISNEQII